MSSDIATSILSKFVSLKGPITDLKLTIDQLNSDFNNAKRSILELAKKIDEVQLCERNEICRAIKDILKDKIKEGKITAKWIEESLPDDYKRKYSKSEQNSLLHKPKKQKMMVDNGGNVHPELMFPKGLPQRDQPENRYERKCSRCLELEDALGKTSQVQTAEKLAERELRVPVPHDKYEELKSVIGRGNGFLYVVIDKSTWSFIRAELDFTDLV
jgi:hypothetical protein